MGMAGGDVNAFALLQLDMNRMLLQTFRIRSEFAATGKIGAKFAVIQDLRIESIGNGQFFCAPNLQKKIMLLIQVKGCRCAR